MRHRNPKTISRLLCGSAAIALCWSSMASAEEQRAFNIEAQPLATALMAFGNQSGHAVMAPMDLMEAKVSRGFAAPAEPEVALAQLLEGTGLTYTRTGDTFAIVQGGSSDPQSGSAAGDGADGTVEALIVTAQKREEDIQDVPIAISAFTQEDLTRSQVAGGPDLMTQVPNFTFTKTNFSSYSIQIRGIGTQAISATVDPAVAVAFNNTPFLRNRFFEQEFYDLQRVEVLRGPQGTLYGRNATAGVVNIISQRPSFGYEAKLSADVANYSSTRLEGMLNIPLVEDKVALRLAGAWTKREGFVTNEITGQPIDGRDLWSTRLSLRFAPSDRLQANLIWEHFKEDDDRLRSGKQLCKRSTPLEVNGLPVPQEDDAWAGHAGGVQTMLSQGCAPASLYSDEAFQVPNGFMLPYYAPLTQIGMPAPLNFDPYTSATQSKDLRVIESTFDPQYMAESDLAELQVEFQLSDTLTLFSETGYNRDSLFSTQDFNRFNTRPGAFNETTTRAGVLVDGVFCDPQLGCSDRLVLGDLSTAKSAQFSQELRLASDYEGPFNFSVGANFVRYDTEDKYYVFANSLSLWAAGGAWATSGAGEYVPGVTDNTECLSTRRPPDPKTFTGSIIGCIYIDPNPITSLNDLGHNYFLSRNPYKLISYAAFGEVDYDIRKNLRVTAGLRWTVDKKEAPRIPSQLLMGDSFGYPLLETVSQEWRKPTGRLTIDWKPDLAFTDETLVYASYAHGYKAGGMNPPPAMLSLYQDIVGLKESLVQPKTFEAEYVDAYEIGTKNTLADGRVTLNANAFYYDYTGYQLSQIINRSAVTQNYDAKIWGLELEAEWRPVENLRISFKQGYENTRVADGEQAIDLMDRTAGDPDWVVMRPFPTVPSNCIVPAWLITWGGQVNNPVANSYGGADGFCAMAYMQNLDPITGLTYTPDPTVFGPPGNFIGPYVGTGYPGWNPETAPNNGEGIFKPLGGNELPNAPDFTTTLTVDYTLPLPNEWLLTLHTDLYRQSEAWTRIFNSDPYDKLGPYTNVNLAAIFTNEDSGWNVMAYVKNVFDKDSITGAFLNSDDTGLTTNVFLTEPRLYGLRVSKSWTGTSWFGDRRSRPPGEPYPITLEIGGGVSRLSSDTEALRPAFIDDYSPGFRYPLSQGEDLDWGDTSEIKLTYAFGKTWRASLGYSQSGANGRHDGFAEELDDGGCFDFIGQTVCVPGSDLVNLSKYNYGLTSVWDSEERDVVDFKIGRDVGIGGLSEGGSSTVSLGVRYAEFRSATNASLYGIPEYYMAPENALAYPFHHTQNEVSLSARRSFEGAGPTLSWDASKTLLGDAATGFVNLDVGVEGGVLFGRQKADVEAAYNVTYHEFLNFTKYETPVEIPPISSQRSKSVSVPVLDLNLGLSYAVDRVKVGAGYRWERYFDAIDGGLRERHAEDRTIDGPYLTFSMGFGG